jgi:hypothetical protein
MMREKTRRKTTDEGAVFVLLLAAILLLLLHLRQFVVLLLLVKIVQEATESVDADSGRERLSRSLAHRSCFQDALKAKHQVFVAQLHKRFLARNGDLGDEVRVEFPQSAFEDHVKDGVPAATVFADLHNLQTT